MCGRYTHFFSWPELHFLLENFTGLILPQEPAGEAYNFAPTQPGWVLAAREGEGSEALQRMRWGLVPYWSKDARMAYSTINARIESASTKPAFREAWKRRRCLVPASGYYEWKGEGAAKQPWFIHDAQAPVMMFGGLWERWNAPDGNVLETYSIVTMPAAGPVSSLHDRMPLILPAGLQRDWLHGSPEQAAELALAAPAPALRFHAVGKAVGNVRSQGAELVRPVAPPDVLL
jgi:putative SOS response-associated peptidase YedK